MAQDGSRSAQAVEAIPVGTNAEMQPPHRDFDITLLVNGVRHRVHVDARTTLLDALRDRLHLTMPVSRFDLANLKLVRAPARVLADKPDKATDVAASGEDATVYRDVLSILRGAERDVLIISPYFIPVDEVMAVFRELRARGVAVRVLTNSLASTDMPPVFAAYARRRPELLQTGVEVYELRPTPGEPRGLLRSYKPSKTALHAKAALVDQRILFVGSMKSAWSPRTAGVRVSRYARSWRPCTCCTRSY